MRILMLGFAKQAHMPYVEFYRQVLAESDHELHLVYWNRDLKPEPSLVDSDAIKHEFRVYQEDEVSKWTKIISFLKYRGFAKRIIRADTYDLLIVLTTIPGILLADLLLTKFAAKYIFDYRDVTYEANPIYRTLVDRLVKKSFATFVSSDAFRPLLPLLDKVYTSHNLGLEVLESGEAKARKSRVGPIRIRFWGLIRHYDINRAMIDRLANDARFELHFHGREQNTGNMLRQYCQAQGVENVFFHGPYENRFSIAAETDLLHNIYENDAQMGRAMTNKFYDGIALRIPQLTQAGSFAASVVSDCGVGLACDPYLTSFATQVFDYYTSISWDEFERKCRSQLDTVLNEYNRGADVVRSVAEGRR